MHLGTSDNLAKDKAVFPDLGPFHSSYFISVLIQSFFKKPKLRIKI